MTIVARRGALGPARRLLWPGVSTLVMLAILLGLGTWQVQRLTWKRGLLDDIARAEAAPSVALPTAPGTPPPPFAKISVTGSLRADLAALYGADVRSTPDGAQMGAQLVVPLERAGADPVLIDRGWVPLTRAHAIAQPAGPVTVEGFVRRPDRAGWFSAADDPAQRRFYTLDPAAIGASMGLSHVAPFTLVAMGAAPAELFPEPAHTLPRPPNDHLSYAATWYGLAVVLLVVFLVWSRKVLRA